MKVKYSTKYSSQIEKTHNFDAKLKKFYNNYH